MTSSTMAGSAGRPGDSQHDVGANFQRTAPPRVEAGVRTSEFDSVVHAQGAWRDDELHMAPVSGLMTAEILAHEPRPELRLARLSFEILGTLHFGPLTVTTRTVRPGRTIELVESTLAAQGRDALVARAWRLVTSDTADVAVIHDADLTPLAECEPFPTMGERWPGGYIQSLHMRTAGDHAPGHGRCWSTTTVDMIAGEETADLVRLMGMVDTANGVATILPNGPGGFAFPNVDLQIHLYREPVGPWLGYATTSNLGSDGIGVTSAVLHDERGAFGRSEQIQTVRRVPAADA
ncbi:thioesterase family protein [Citricoccus nitrophenolicus]|uniref:thioesterase family protein n=1 Tax=Citricoccus nitrophenolicus TaxID=863575 RepID=UPI0031EA66E1